MKNYVTMQDIANRLKLSRSAVSFALNDQYDGIRISEEIRRKIKQTASELGYCRNAVVQSLVSGRTKLIACIAREDVHYEYSFRTFTGLIKKLSENGYSARFILTDSQAEPGALFQQIVEQRIEGIAVRTNDQAMMLALIEQGKTRNIPVAFFDQPPVGDGGIFVKSDDASGISEALGLLQRQGHQHIGQFGLYDDPADERARAFHDAINQFHLKNLPEDNFYAAAPDEQRRLIGKLLDRPATMRPSAYFCASDYIAALLMQECYKRGMRLPQELSVVGFGNLYDINMLYPELTTVDQPFEHIGACAAQLLIGEIEDSKRTSYEQPIIRKIATHLIERQSTMAIQDQTS